MWTRTKSTSEGSITATFSYDPGDASVGINPGWGEDTGAEIRYALAPGEFGGYLVTYISFRDVEVISNFSAQTGKRTHIHKQLDDPADWIVDDVQTEYKPYGDDAPSLTLTDLILAQGKPILGREPIRLSKLPEVLDVVREVYADMLASQRLSAAQESVQTLEAEVELVQWERKESRCDAGLIRIAGLMRELELAKIELVQAEQHAKERGVT